MQKTAEGKQEECEQVENSQVQNSQEMYNPDEERVYQLLAEMEIPYQIKHHPPVFTTEEAKALRTDFPGMKMKNLFVKDRANNTYYLVVLRENRRLDFNELRRLTGGKKACFTSPEELMHFLGLIPGAVTPFGLIHENAGQVILVLDYDIACADSGQTINFHPCVNTATLALSVGDFKKVIARFGNPVVEEAFCGQLDKQSQPQG